MDSHSLVKDFAVALQSAKLPIVWSKTLQLHYKALSYPLLRIPNSVLCPFTALKHMVDKTALEDAKPCFAHPNGSPWTYSQFHNKLRQKFSLCGYRSQQFSSHSFRRGGCSFAW